MALATVEFWLDEEGWGAIALDDGTRVFVHFSHIENVEGYRALTAGQRVDAEVMAMEKDEFTWVATGIRVLT